MNFYKITIYLSIFIANIFNTYAQYNHISYENSSSPEIKIVQIDFRDLSTLVHFEFTNNNHQWICSNENVYIQDKFSHKKYNLLNSINLPFCPKSHYLNSPNQKHYFTLEFEKVPENIDLFDIIEINDDGGRGWYFNGCKIDSESYVGNFIDVTSFTKTTPIKEYGYYYNNGRKTYYYKNDDIVISAFVSIDRKYGKYYHADIIIQNFSGKDLTFNPSLITAQFTKDGELSSLEALTHGEYMKKVKNRQAWATAAIALSESIAALNAGYSSTNSSTHSSTNSSTNYFIGGNHGTIYGNSNTYSSTYSSTYSNTYNGAAAYAAQLNATRNINSHTNQQHQIKNQINQGYAKTHTINNYTEYLGYVNIKFTESNEIKLVVPFNNTDYTFTYTFNSESEVVEYDELPFDKFNHKKEILPETENKKPGIYYKENICLIDKEISLSDVKIKCLNETGRAYDKYTIKKSELTFHETNHIWKITEESLTKKDEFILENNKPGIYYKGNNCLIDQEISLTLVKIKCLNETGRAYDKYTIKKSDLIFHEVRYEWQIAEQLSNEGISMPEGNSPGLYFNGVFCKIIEKLPGGHVKIKYLNETGRAYDKKIVHINELTEIK